MCVFAFILLACTVFSNLFLPLSFRLFLFRAQKTNSIYGYYICTHILICGNMRYNINRNRFFFLVFLIIKNIRKYGLWNLSFALRIFMIQIEVTIKTNDRLLSKVEHSMVWRKVRLGCNRRTCIHACKSIALKSPF